MLRRKQLKLNLGCGLSKLKDFINIDIEPKVEPDLIQDFRLGLPQFKNNSVSEVYLIHTIEHIEEKYHFNMLTEVYRVLKPNGLFFCAYPEFTKAAQNYITNYLGQREFWKATIYGRQLYPGDYHVSLMDSSIFKQTLINAGFKPKSLIIKPEVQEHYNTRVWAFKGKPPVYYEESVKRAIWQK